MHDCLAQLLSPIREMVDDELLHAWFTVLLIHNPIETIKQPSLAVAQCNGKRRSAYERGKVHPSGNEAG